MLRLYLGRAGSGKTSYILNELASRREEGSVLIVPEQYSHDCERALAALGDSVCLYAQVLSFTRLCNRVFSETGGLSQRMLDAGGRTLAMSMAYMSVSSRLKIYDVGGRRPDFITNLTAAYDELRSASVGTDSLLAAAENAHGNLRDKLTDLALIFEAFEAVKARSGADARDRLERLSQEIGQSSVGSRGRVYIDGFTDFTYQEKRVIEALLRKGADVTVSLNCPEFTDTDITFRLGIRTAQSLLAAASELGERAEILRFPEKPGRDGALRYLERNLMDYSAPPYEGDASAVGLVRAACVSDECGAAAARVSELVRAGARYRDIAVVSPTWGTYAPVLEGVFQKYGLPVTRTERSDILDKPVMALILSALDIITNNWDYGNIFKYLKTNLTGIGLDERDLLENYVLKWNLRGERAWGREWTMSPGGYTQELRDTEREALETLNALRRRVSEPLSRLGAAMRAGEGASDKLRALYGFMEETELYGILERKAGEFRAAGREELAAEYRQLWDIVVGAMEQFSEVLGDTPMDTEEFTRLLKLVLSRYTVGVIPASVDAVRAGDMSRIRARGIKHLIVLGATDDALPQRRGEGGVFSEEEREELRDLGLGNLDSREDALARELSGVYASLTVPTESLTVSWPQTKRPSYVAARLQRLFSVRERVPGLEVFTAAREPLFELAAFDEGETGMAARRYFSESELGERLRAIRDAACAPRGELGGETARRLYGRRLRLSATQVDKYYACRYAYFLQYGLRAKPRSEAALDAPESGTFMHFILEHVSREAEARGGFGKVTEQEVRAMVPDFVAQYAQARLGGMENKSGRFKYLYARLAKTAEQVAVVMREELVNSDFKPLDFELRFAPDGELPAMETPTGDSVVGAVDRVDGWVRDGKLYIRVVDYKTGRMTMNLRDVVNGVGLQMLIYLFALEREGKSRYGMDIVPTGVLYSPARDEMVSSVKDLDDQELEKERQKLIKYSGLILADPEVLEAMEHGTKKRLPITVSTRTGEVKGALADARQLGALSRTVDRLICDMARELKAGAISANPYLRGKLDSACGHCKFYDACHFVDGKAGESWRRFSNLKTPELWKKIEEAGK